MTSHPTTPPMTLGDRINLAEKMATGGCTVDQIVLATGLAVLTARAIKQRVSPDYGDFSRLRRNTLEVAG